MYFFSFLSAIINFWFPMQFMSLMLHAFFSILNILVVVENARFVIIILFFVNANFVVHYYNSCTQHELLLCSAC